VPPAPTVARQLRAGPSRHLGMAVPGGPSRFPVPRPGRSRVVADSAGRGHNPDGGTEVVPHPLSEPVRHDGRWYCLTRYVRRSRAAGHRHPRRLRRAERALPARPARRRHRLRAHPPGLTALLSGTDRR
jgi:hypothetical protein